MQHAVKFWSISHYELILYTFQSLTFFNPYPSPLCFYRLNINNNTGLVRHEDDLIYGRTNLLILLLPSRIVFPYNYDLVHR